MHKDFGREVFVPEPGHVIITADLSQIDARAIAAHCQDPGYLALFEDGRDFHAEVAERVLGSTQHRSIAKVINHATSYGAGAGLIAKTAGVGLDDARQFLRDMEAAYPLWAAWRRDTVERARSGELLDNGFSRRVRPNPGRIETTAVAIVGQACARDLLVECLFRLDDKGLTPNLRMIVHDEVVLSVPKDIAQDVQQTIRECMSFDWAPPSCEIPVPIRATVSEGRDSWSAVK